jgi:hypothetical protein
MPLRPWLAEENDSTTWPLAGQRHSTSPTGVFELGAGFGVGLEVGFDTEGLLAGFDDDVFGLLATPESGALRAMEMRWPG